MTEEKITDIANVLHVREQAIAKQIHFYSIVNNAKNNSKYSQLPVSSIILGLLDYLTIEGNLKSKGIPYIEVQEFIGELLEKKFNIKLQQQELAEFTNYLFKRLSNDGKSFEYEFFNTTTGVVEVVTTKYITSKADAQSGFSVLVYITSEGMELLLNTKEVSDKYAVSVHLLLLEKMIETNNLEDVLIGAKNLNAEVVKQINKKKELLEILKYAPESKYEQYIDYIKSTTKIIKDDGIKLSQIKVSVKKYEEDLLSNLKKNDLTLEEKEVLRTLAKKINLELEMCIGNHYTLLSETVDFIKNIPEIQKNRLIRRFSTHFNIEDKVNTLVRNDRVDALRYIVDPLLSLNIKKEFNILKIDSMFNYKEKPEQVEETEKYIEGEVSELFSFGDLVKETMNDNYIFYMRNLLLFINEFESSDLNAFNEYLRELHGTMPINNADIRTFVLSLNQGQRKVEYTYKDLIEKTDKSAIEKVFIEVVKEYKDIEFMDKKLVLTLQNEMIQLTEYFTSNNIMIECIKI